MTPIEKVCIGAKLTCDTCKNTVPINPSRVGAYVRHGWPECCGQTMRLVTKAEQAGEVKQDD